MNIKDLIVTIRKEHNLTQEELAKRLFKSQRTISSYEKGRIQPTVDVLNQLSKEFNIQILINNDFRMVQDENTIYNDVRDEILESDIYYFITDNLCKEDYSASDVMSYAYLSFDYKNLLPAGIDEYLKELKIDSRNIVGVIDKFSNLALFYKKKDRAEAFFCSNPCVSNNWKQLLKSIVTTKEEDLSALSKYKYTYIYNELWAFYLEENMEYVGDTKNITKEQIIFALYSSVESLIINNDDRVFNLTNIDTHLLKQYTEDISLGKDKVSVFGSVYKKFDDTEGVSVILLNKDISTDDILNSNEWCQLELNTEDIILCSPSLINNYCYVVVESHALKRIKERIKEKLTIR